MNESWRFDRLISFGGALLGLIVLVGKFFWGTWELGFAAGSFIVAATGLMFTIKNEVWM